MYVHFMHFSIQNVVTICLFMLTLHNSRYVTWVYLLIGVVLHFTFTTLYLRKHNVYVLLIVTNICKYYTYLKIMHVHLYVLNSMRIFDA